MIAGTAMVFVVAALHDERSACRGLQVNKPLMLRLATPADTESVTDVLFISRETFLPFAKSPHSRQGFRSWVAEYLIPGGRVTVATVDHEIVGVLAVSEDQGIGWIDQLYVHPDHVSVGVGSLLLQHAHAVLKHPIRLFTFQENMRARSFYERHGYQPIRFSDGQDNEEKCPDVLYEWTGPTPISIQP
ncbi:GNAT family N-acetyltransferase [Chitiniphilus eburneus]|uniref:GNAT family N-acetyltransferase n=1 Tax=Chitiniphilus eburneus TaxID=2571148 RepID=A0A4U0PCE8_9NEIS|nr:GNAT family N-acetyltransferase [Chitiniphilus eburneus]TJZ65381.1 GNAT family N-acetyltransferase [Chitiniphilus eburneus]